jgi:2-polyprenyl-6-hydroxyphenyl methylase/3-demethylubiquinone-9 3-methyltransferase
VGRIVPRFGFGDNWQRFRRSIDERRIMTAMESIASMLRVPDLEGKSFLDVASGSGLFSLAAMRLGADRVHSFDYDRQSVACTEAVRAEFLDEPANWTVERGDCLDDEYLERLGRFDIVYAWGVLHHTGDMWCAITLAAGRVAREGLFYVALYNDQGWRSSVWRAIKRFYCSGFLGRWLVLVACVPTLIILGFGLDVARRRNPFERYGGSSTRGMSELVDHVDWLGGYPFDVATPDSVVRHLEGLGFELKNVRTTRGWGCNEFVFRCSSAGADD